MENFNASREFLATPEWVECRKSAYRSNHAMYGKLTCERCGCVAEGKHCADHILPRLKYPWLALSWFNLQILCIDCNKWKSNSDETDYRPWRGYAIPRLLVKASRFASKLENYLAALR